MARKKSWNPESHGWKGKSYKRSGKRVRDLRDQSRTSEDHKNDDILRSIEEKPRRLDIMSWHLEM